jgi:hypothetical protein
MRCGEGQQGQAVPAPAQILAACDASVDLRGGGHLFREGSFYIVRRIYNVSLVRKEPCGTRPPEAAVLILNLIRPRPPDPSTTKRKKYRVFEVIFKQRILPLLVRLSTLLPSLRIGTIRSCGDRNETAEEQGSRSFHTSSSPRPIASCSLEDARHERSKIEMSLTIVRDDYTRPSSHLRRHWLRHLHPTKRLIKPNRFTPTQGSTCL